MRNTFIMSGPSGSGKTHSALELAEALGSGTLISADHYFNGLKLDYAGISFGRLNDADIKETLADYVFDPDEIHLAHQQCRRAFIRALESGNYENIIVDNTHIWAAEKSVYYDHASDYGEVEIIRMNTSLDDCLARNTHGVPDEIVRRMHYVHNARDYRGNLRETMPWWKTTDK